MNKTLRSVKAHNWPAPKKETEKRKQHDLLKKVVLKTMNVIVEALIAALVGTLIGSLGGPLVLYLVIVVAIELIIAFHTEQ